AGSHPQTSPHTPPRAVNQARTCHLRHCCGRKNSHTAILTAIENHLTVNRQVVCRRKQASLPCNSVHSKRSWIVNLTPQPDFSISSRIRCRITEVTQLAATFFSRSRA